MCAIQIIHTLCTFTIFSTLTELPRYKIVFSGGCKSPCKFLLVSVPISLVVNLTLDTLKKTNLKKFKMGIIRCYTMSFRMRRDADRGGPTPPTGNPGWLHFRPNSIFLFSAKIKFTDSSFSATKISFAIV